MRSSRCTNTPSAETSGQVGALDDARQVGSGQDNKRGQWTMQDEQVADNVGQSGGE